MEYELLMENWRKLLRELDVNPVAGSTSMDTAPLATKGLSNDQAIKYSDTVKKVYKGDIGPEVGKIFASAGLILVKELGLLFEPTGQIADVNIDTGKITYTYQLVDQSSKAAVAAYKRGDYLAAGLNSAGAALASLAMIPIAGKVAKGLKKLIPAKRIEQSRKVMAKSQNLAKNLKATNNPELVAKGIEIEESLEQIYNFRKSLKKTKIHSYTSMTRLRKASKMLLSPIKTKIAKRIKAGSLKINTKLNIKLKFDQDIDFDDFAADFWGMGTGSSTFRATTKDGSRVDAFSGISNLKISFIPEKTTGELMVSGGIAPGLTQRETLFQLEFKIPDQYINTDGTIKPQALEEMFDQANETYMHELFHSFQKNEKFKSSKKQPRLDDLDSSDYAKYRAADQEMQAWAIQFAGRKNYMNRDALTSMWKDMNFNPAGMTQKEIDLRTQILTRQIKFAKDKFPCMRGSWGLWKPVLDLSRDEGLKAKFSDFYKLEANGKINDKTLIPFGDCKKFRHYKGKGKVGGWNDKKLTKQIKEHLERIIKEELEALMQEKIN